MNDEPRGTSSVCEIVEERLIQCNDIVLKPHVRGVAMRRASCTRSIMIIRASFPEYAANWGQVTSLPDFLDGL